MRYCVEEEEEYLSRDILAKATMWGLLILTTWITCVVQVTSLHITPLGDGVIVRRKDDIQVQRGVWKVVITLQDTTPDYRELIRREIYRLHAHVVALPRSVHLSTRVTYWLSVLGRLGREVDTVGPSVHPGEH